MTDESDSLASDIRKMMEGLQFIPRTETPQTEADVSQDNPNEDDREYEAEDEDEENEENEEHKRQAAQNRRSRIIEAASRIGGEKIFCIVDWENQETYFFRSLEDVATDFSTSWQNATLYVFPKDNGNRQWIAGWSDDSFDIRE